MTIRRIINKSGLVELVIEKLLIGIDETVKCGDIRGAIKLSNYVLKLADKFNEKNLDISFIECEHKHSEPPNNS